MSPHFVLPKISQHFSQPPAHVSRVLPPVWISVRYPLMRISWQKWLASKKWEKWSKCAKTDIDCRRFPRGLTKTLIRSSPEVYTQEVLARVELEPVEGFVSTYEVDTIRLHLADGLSTNCVYCVRPRAVGTLMTDGKQRRGKRRRDEDKFFKMLKNVDVLYDCRANVIDKRGELV